MKTASPAKEVLPPPRQTDFVRLSPKQLESALSGMPLNGRVVRMVGGQFFYVYLTEGRSILFHPEHILIKRRGRAKNYGGQTLRSLGIRTGSLVQVFQVGDPQLAYRVVSDQDLPRTFIQWLWALL